MNTFIPDCANCGTDLAEEHDNDSIVYVFAHAYCSRHCASTHIDKQIQDSLDNKSGIHEALLLKENT